jgi:phosphate transport system substrate-binding protein
MRKTVIIYFVALFSVFFQMSAYAAEVVRVEGGGAAIATVFGPMKEHFEKDTGMVLSITQSTPFKGLVALVEGRADVATGAVSLEDMIKGAAKEGVTVNPASLQKLDLTVTRTVVFTHKSNKVAKLSKEQLKKIFTGKITNWKDVGGQNLPIQVVWGNATPGQNAKFTREILGGAAVTAKARRVTNYASIRDTVAATPGAIGIDPLGMATNNIHTPKVPSITSPIIVVTKGKPTPAAQKVFDYFKEEFGYLNK